MANGAFGKITDFEDSKPNSIVEPDVMEDVSIAFGTENFILVPDLRLA